MAKAKKAKSILGGKSTTKNRGGVRLKRSPKPRDLQSELVRYMHLAMMLMQKATNEVIWQKADDFGKDKTSELEIEIGEAGYRNLKEPDILEHAQRRAEHVIRIASEAMEAHKQRDIDAVGVLCIRLGEAWELTVAAAYGPMVRTERKKVEALDTVNRENRKRDGLAAKVRAVQDREGCKQAEAIRKVAEAEGVSVTTVKRNIYEKVHPLG